MKKENKAFQKKVLTLTFISLGVLAAFLALTGLKIIPMNGITILIFAAAALAYGGYMKHIADKEMEKQPVKIVDSNTFKFSHYFSVAIMIIIFAAIYFLPKIEPEVMIKLMPRMSVIFRVVIVISVVVYIYSMVKGNFKIEAKPGATKKQIEEVKKQALKGSRSGIISLLLFILLYIVLSFILK